MSSALRVNAAIAVFALLLFELIGLASGRLDVRGGLGWDGASYARMVTGALSDGTANTAVRPLVILAVRIPYHLGLDVVRSFELVNAVAAFVLYFVAALFLQRGGLAAPVRAVVVANLALTISVSKMFGFYPSLIDLGALAVIATAVYLVAGERLRAAAAVCVLATAAREFGVAASLFGLHRAIRRRRWADALLFLPSLVVPVLIRVPALGILPAGGTPLSLAHLASNLRMWGQLPFVTTFVYFALTLLGGLTVLLVLRPRALLAGLRDEPELVTYLGFIGAATAAGDADIPRYLVFALPAALVLIPRCLRDLDVAGQLRVLVVVTLITVLTQRPLQAMTVDAYFLDWYPLYRVPGGGPVPAEVLTLWVPRLVSLALAVAAAHLVIRQTRRGPPAPAGC